MSYRRSALVEKVTTPPIADAQRWVTRTHGTPAQTLLDLSQAVPSYPPAPRLRAHLAKTATQAETAFYTDICGLPALRKQLARSIADEYGGRIDAKQVIITSGCNQAFCVAIDALTQPGDEVILPLPYYFNHHMWLEMRGVTPVFLPFAEGRAGVPDPEAAKKLLGPRTRAIVLVTPNNPTGAQYPGNVINAFYELAHAAGLALLVDETYKDFRCGAGAPHGLFQRSSWADTFVHLYSFSKAYSLTGYRVGAIVAGAELVAEAEKILDCLAICPSRIGQEAALFALRELDDWRNRMANTMRGRVDALRRGFQHNALEYTITSIGAYFAWVRHPFRGVRATQVAKTLAAEHAVLALPGEMFGPDQQDYLRFAFANLDGAEFPDLVERLLASQT